MKLSQLSALVALVEAGSMRGAARELGVTQPALSTRIAELERDVGAHLVHRTARGTTLTSAGHALLAHARTICNQVDRAQAEMARLSQSSSPTVSLGASPLAAGELIAPLLNEVQGIAHFKVTEGQFHDLAPDMREGGLEMIIAPIPPGHRDTKVFQFEELVTYPMHVVARAGHPLAGCRRLVDLCGASWVVGAATSTHRSTVEELYAAQQLPPPQIALHSDSISLVQASIVQADLLGLLPVPLFSLLSSSVQALRIEDPIRPIRLGLITLAGIPTSPAAQLFADFVRKRSEDIAKRLALQRRSDAEDI